ncbi:MAG: mannonate dehydratase [Spirochaetes bacterium]|nr:mannonate dehydratase [Spirochaetota bacterium]
MEITFRWYGDDDPVPLQYIRQIPSVTGVVSALYDVPVGEQWPREKLAALQSKVESAGLRLSVIESIPVHEDIKLGRPGRDELIDNYCASVRNMGSLGIGILCYNFMPVFDWTRTQLARLNDDGSTSLAYDHGELAGIDPAEESLELPGWAAGYGRKEQSAHIAAFRGMDEEALWRNLEYFLKRVVPVAEGAGVRMGIHPDDPPWPIFGLPRIIKDERDLDRLVAAVDSPSNGITFCTGSLGPNAEFGIEGALEKYCAAGRVPFVHCRNIRRTGERAFIETAHPTEQGDVDMFAVMKTLVRAGFSGALRPDHGRMIWGETGRPGYGLYDRALGAMYLAGLREALQKELNPAARKRER